MSGKTQRSWERQRLTLDQAMKRAGISWVDKPDPLVRYDPNVDPCATMRQGSAHDGTLLFSMEIMNKAISPFLNRQVRLESRPPEDDEDVVVTFGRISTMAVFGNVKVNGMAFEGMRERVLVPVLVTYEKKSGDPQ